MEVVRNHIKIKGLTPESELPNKVNGQVIEYSQVEYIYIEQLNPEIDTIKEIYIKLEASSGRVVNAPMGKIILLDGIKKLKISYISKENTKKQVSVEVKIPFNTFIDMPYNAGDVNNIDVYMVDSYFHLVGDRKIYCHNLYMIDVNYTIRSTDK